MKRSVLHKCLIPLLSLGMILASSLGQLDAEEPKVLYFYDDLGRLKRVIDEQGDVRTYRYDAVGNICAIEAGPGACPVGPPVVTSIQSAPCLAGTSCQITIEGSSLLGAAVVSGNAQAPVSHCMLVSTPVTDCGSLPATEGCSRMTCRLTPSPFLVPGPVSIVATTPLGSAEGSVDILAPPNVCGADIWHFVANSGAVITLSMSRIPNQADGSSTLDPYLELQDSRGFVLARDDEGGTSDPPGPGRNAVIRDFVLPATETYLVVARGAGGHVAPMCSMSRRRPLH